MTPLTTAQLQAAFKDKLATSALDLADAKKLKFTTHQSLSSITDSFPAISGFKIPYFDVNGKPIEFFRVRTLQDSRSSFDLLAGKKQQRYMQPAKTAAMLYMPPNEKWSEITTNTTIPITITEGELKAACACKYGVPTIGLGGVWSFMQSKAGKSLIDEFKLFEWADRDVFICYDSDAATNPDIVRAEIKLAEQLTTLGAVVHVCRIKADGEDKWGIDDFILHKGPDAFTAEVILTAEKFAKTEALHNFNQEVVYVKRPGVVFVYEDGVAVAPQHIVAHRFSDRKYEERSLNAAGTQQITKLVSTAAKWLEWPHRASVGSITYAPGQPRITDSNQLNQWTAWGVAEPKKGDVKPWKEMLDRIFTGAPPEYRVWFERWCAYPLQHPGTKMNSAALFWGSVKGSGKTIIGTVLMELYGANAVELKDAGLEDPRNEWAVNKQFVLADDITGHGNRKLANRLKTMITQKTILLNPKYVPSYTIPDCINYFFTSNDPDAFFLEDGERRYFIHEVPTDVGKLPFELRDRVVKWRDSEAGIAALFDYLLHLDLGDFDPQADALETRAKQDMTNISKSEIAMWVLHLREEPEAVLNANKLLGDLYTADELYRLYDPNKDKRASPNALSRELKRAGYDKAGANDTLKVASGIKRIYIVRNPERWKKASVKEMIDHYDKYHPLMPSAKKVKF